MTFLYLYACTVYGFNYFGCFYGAGFDQPGVQCAEDLYLLPSGEALPFSSRTVIC